MEQCDAIVLRVYPWSESSCVATLFTNDHGKLSVLAKGARRPKSPFEAALDLLSICRVVFISKSSDALDILTEAKLTRRFRVGSRDLLRLYCGYYVIELLDRLTEKGDKHPPLFDLATATLNGLEEETNEPAAIVLRFELQMLRHLGHLPSWDRCVACGIELLAEHENKLTNNGQLSRHQEWHLFSAVSGGVLCAGCRQQGRQLIRIPEAARKQLHYFSQSDWKQIDLRANDSRATELQANAPATRATIRRVMERYFTTLLDGPPKLHPYLEELGS